MLDQLPVRLHPYIEDIVDVKCDGNCGYRAIGSLLGVGEDSWPLVRDHLMKEIQEQRADYNSLFGRQLVDELINSLFVERMANVDKWITLPEMGYVIACRYNVVLVSLSLQQSMTFFPLRGRPSSNLSDIRVITIAFVDTNHFVQVSTHFFFFIMRYFFFFIMRWWKKTVNFFLVFYRYI